MIGTKGFWIDDNAYCEITGVENEGAGMYEFTAIDPDPSWDEDTNVWVGYIEDFFPEDNYQC